MHSGWSAGRRMGMIAADRHRGGTDELFRSACGASAGRDLFIGTLFFEVMILGRIRQQIGEQTMPLVERAVGARSRVVLHWVVLFVYGAGIGLAWYHRQALANPFASSFATQLTLKIVLAVGVFLTFGLVAVLLRKGG